MGRVGLKATMDAKGNKRLKLWVKRNTRDVVQMLIIYSMMMTQKNEKRQR